jgi:hypothetical protein
MHGLAPRFRTTVLLGVLGTVLYPIRASNIAVIRTAEEVVIASDSSGVIQGDGLSPAKESVCKIYRVDDQLFFAVSGLVNDARSGYSVPATVATGSYGGGTISEKRDRIERAVSPALLHEVGELKQRDPQGYDKLTKSGGAVSVILIGIEDGIPIAVSFSLGLGSASDGILRTIVTRDSCPGNCPSGVRAFSIGPSTAVEAIRRGRGLPALAMPELAEFMVQAEIDAGTDGVSGPVDVLRLTPSGPVWIRKKATCPATASTDFH